MLDALTDLVATPPGAYAVVMAVVLTDAFFPIVPGETLVITASLFAERGDLSLLLVLLAAFAGAVAGDNISYLLGAKLGRRAARRLFRSEKARRRLGWCKGQLGERGRGIVVAARFIPGGRTAVTFGAGTLHMPWRRFLAADAVGGALWSLYATALGYLGGETFRENVWKPLLVAFAIAALVAAGGELYRRLSARRRRQQRTG